MTKLRTEKGVEMYIFSKEKYLADEDKIYAGGCKYRLAMQTLDSLDGKEVEFLDEKRAVLTFGKKAYMYPDIIKKEHCVIQTSLF